MTLNNFPGLLEFPGGGIDANENPEDALARELLEELQIEVHHDDIKHFEGNMHQNTIEKSGKVVHLTLFIVDRWKGILTPDPNIHSELISVPLLELGNFNDIIPGDAIFIPLIQSLLTP